MKIIALLLVAHFVGDFVFQRHAWAIKKSSSNVALTKHVLVYAATLAVMCVGLFGWRIGVLFAAVNGLTHWITDYVTSRQTKRLWIAERVHDFFVVVGLDQLIGLLALWNLGA